MSSTEADIREFLLAMADQIAHHAHVSKAVRDAAADMAFAKDLEAAMQGMVGLILIAEEAAHRAKGVHEAAREALLSALTDSGAYLVETQHHTATVVNGAPAVIVTEPNLLDERYWIMPRPVPDKDKIKRVLKAGKQVDGATLSNGAPHLRLSARK